MHIEEFINKYTVPEVEKIDRKDVFYKFESKMAIQRIATKQATGQRETSPIRSPQRFKSPDRSPLKLSPIKQD